MKQLTRGAFKFLQYANCNINCNINVITQPHSRDLPDVYTLTLGHWAMYQANPSRLCLYIYCCIVMQE